MDWEKLKESIEIVAELVIELGLFFLIAAGLAWAIEIIGQLIREI